MDLSTLLELERCGAKYYDHGKERDILDIMRDYDVDTIRLRLWNDPYSETGEPYGAGCNDLAETIAIGKKVSDAGFGFNPSGQSSPLVTSLPTWIIVTLTPASSTLRRESPVNS